MSYRSTIGNTLKSFESAFVTYNNIYISRSAILHNFDHFAAAPHVDHVIPVLKANAYGHGLEQVATILQDRSMPYIAVDSYFEALRIRKVSKQPVLVMGAIDPVNFANMRLNGYAFVVHDTATIRALAATRKKIKLHIEIETGMNRHGVPIDRLEDFLKLLRQFPSLQVEGIMSHLADADNPKSDEFVKTQVARFDTAVEAVQRYGFDPTYIHIAQSAGSTKVHSKTANTLRPGISLYGISPLADNDKQSGTLSDLKPALTLTSTIAKVVELAPGDTVSYNRTFITNKPTRIGVLPLGYYEGVPRSLSNKGVVKYGNGYLPIVGRVCMNHTMIDLTDTHAKLGDVVTIISDNRGHQNTVSSICRTHNLFNYELLVHLNENIRRTISA